MRYFLRMTLRTKALSFKIMLVAGVVWTSTLGLLTYTELSNFKDLVNQSTQLIRTQEGSQGVAIGHYGASSLFLKLVESDGRYQVTQLKLSSTGQTSLERTFPPSKEFSWSENLGLSPRFQTDLGNFQIQGAATISHKVLAESLLISLACALLAVGALALACRINQNHVLLLTATSRAELAKQVAHDIRSPLSAINLIAGQLTGVQLNQKEILHSAVNRINEIASDLLMKSRHGAIQDSASGEPTPNTVSEEIPFEVVLSSLLNEKKLEYSNHTNIDFAVDTPYPEPTIILGSRTDLARVLSNILNNSVESMQERGGRITISVRRYAKFLEVSIVDKGCGIPVHILEQLGKEPLSHGKGNAGSGIGILHARRYVESIGGTFSISSRVNRGTMVRLSLRRVVA
ncbi:MAG: HAMP domain-containing histidine kinase [Bdellovibrionaceae bacterium]|nr:HAMP domain-containing histidine kinase [Pseudobdellovibrionaceae bacterium]